MYINKKDYILLLKKGTKRATQGIQDKYTHTPTQLKQKRSGPKGGAKTSPPSTRAQPIKETN